MAWGDKTTLTGLNVSLSETTNVDADFIATNHFSQWVTLNPGESAHIQVAAAFGSTGSDMIFRIITTLDDTSETADTSALLTGVVPYVASTTQLRSLFLTGPYKFRIDVRKYGTTAGAYTPNVYIRKNGFSL